MKKFLPLLIVCIVLATLTVGCVKASLGFRSGDKGFSIGFDSNQFPPISFEMK